MRGVPTPALVLGLAGLLPFIGGAAAVFGLLPGVSNPVTGYLILQSYGAAILAFMGGCLWGFAAQAGRDGWAAYALAVVPGLWAFAATFTANAILTLILGFIVLQGLDILFRSWGLGPKWWLSLRFPLTGVVLICLIAGALA